jgi:DNA-binding NtrC family response regulator
MAQIHILVADDDVEIRDSLRDLLAGEGFLCDCVANGEEAIALLEKSNYDLVITDLNMPVRNGMELLKYISSFAPKTSAMIITAHATVETAVEALRKGAIDYILKPIDPGELLHRIHHINRFRRTLLENQNLRKEIREKFNFSNIIGDSPAMKQVYHMVSRVANSTSNVLITGKSGTGKELIARAIHDNSPRKNEPFVPINCGALPETLFESELFGFRKGAFTGANQDKDGVFKSASGGTLFLDEVGEIPVHIQVKLLRAIETKEIKPLGSSNPIHVNVRILSATNKDLLKEVEEGNFREDLYYRLNIVEIHLPSLRERQEDIPLLVNHFINKYNHELKRKVRGVDNDTMKALINHSWKGEVRELENMIERAVLLCDGEYLTIDNLQGSSMPDTSLKKSFSPPLKNAVREFEKYHIRRILEMVEYDKAKAAEFLDIGLSSLYRKIDELDI